MNTAPMSRRPRARSSRSAVTRWIAPCHARNAPANTATVSAGRSNGTVPVAPGRKRSVSAPHSSSRIFAARRVRRAGWRRSASRSGRRAGKSVRASGASARRAARDRAAASPSPDSRRPARSLRARATRADSRRRGDPLAAEVVVALDDDVGADAPRDARGRRGRCAQRSSFRPSGGGSAIQLHRCRPETRPPGRHRARARRVRARASPSATAVTWTDPPVVPGTVWSEARRGSSSTGQIASDDAWSATRIAPVSLLDQQREERTRADPSEQQQVELHRERQRAQRRVGRRTAGDPRLRRRCAPRESPARPLPSGRALAPSRAAARLAIARSAMRIRMFSTKPPTIGV